MKKRQIKIEKVPFYKWVLFTLKKLQDSTSTGSTVVLTGYDGPGEAEGVTPTDTLNEAIAKLEARIDAIT